MTKVSVYNEFLAYLVHSKQSFIGFSSWPDDQGTYRGSCTWFQAAIIHSGGELSERRDFQHNIHGSFISRVHTNVWRSQDQHTSQWLALLSAGDDLLVIPRAQYPAWKNYVDYIQVDLHVAL